MSDDHSSKKTGQTVKERPERDLSPSALSQCSTGLEWDPSADVGTTSGIHHDDEDDHHNSKEVLTGDSLPPHFQKSKSPVTSSASHEDAFSASEKTSTVNPGVTEKSVSGSSSSVIWVEVEHKLEPRNQSETREIKLKNVGIQTSDSEKRNIELTANTSDFSNVYHSTPTENYRSQAKGITKKMLNLQEQDPDVKVNVKGRRRERSPPQPFKVASRKSSHRHHDAHHSRVHEEDDEDVSPRRSRLSEKKITSSSELSSSCLLIDKLVKPGRLSAKKEEMLNALEMHRDYHVNKVRHELKQLEKLNQLLSKNLKTRNRISSTSSDNSELKNKDRYHTDVNRRKLSPSKTRPTVSNTSKKASPVKAKKIVEHPPTSDYSSSSTSNTTIKDSSSRETYTLSESGNNAEGETTKHKKEKQRSDAKPDSRDVLEKKLDKLLDAFTSIAEMLSNNKENISNKKITSTSKTSSIKSSANKSSTNRTSTNKNKISKTKKECIKPSVAYFVPFPNSDGNYVFRKEDIDISKKKSNTSTNKSKQKADNGKGDVKGKTEEEDKSRDENSQRDKEEESDDGESQKPVRFTLQDAFQRRHPTFINSIQEREAVLARLKAEREVRAEKKREWIRQCGESSEYELKGIENSLPPRGPRLMTTKEMKELTERRYKRLPEVRDKIIQRKKEEERKTNRLMSQVFASKLRRGVLKGEMNIQHSTSLIRR